MKNILLFFLIALFMDGVFSESVSVTEGDSVTLHTDLTEIQKNDVIQWRFKKKLIAQFNTVNEKISTYDVLNVRFKDSLTLDNQTGDLTIRNIRTEHAGDYEVSNLYTLKWSFIVSVVSAGVKSVSVMVGDSVTLHTGLTDIQRYDVIRWRFDHQNSPVAEINRKAGIFSTYDGADGRFRHRLQLEYWTGSLTIKNIGTSHSGLYEVDIISTSRRYTIHKSFSVTISDAVKSVSVKEGETVTLLTVTEIQSNDQILWMFGDTVLAEINKADQRFSTSDGPDERFRDRLQLDHQTGSLNIIDTRTTHSGLYELKISSSRRTINRRIIVTVTDAVKSVSVKEGETVTLQTVTEIQKDDQILWMFGDIDLAEINKADQRFFTSDGPDERFRDRLQLDHQTGSLTIRNTRTTDSGLYELKISSSRRTINRRIIVTVTDAGMSSAAIAWITGVAVAVAVAVAVGGIYYCNKISQPNLTWKTLSVIEGETVPLHPSGTEIIEEDNIRWLFNKSNLAEIKKKASASVNVLLENFKERLDWPGNLGPLIIENIQIQDSGIYELQIIRSENNIQTLEIFSVSVYAKTDDIKIKEVKEGGSVTLESDVTRIQKDDEILWKFEFNTPIAAIQGGRKKIPPFATGWRYRCRLKLDENGSLTIRNIRPLDTGFYVLHITRRGNTSLRLFSVKIFNPSEKMHLMSVGTSNS